MRLQVPRAACLEAAVEMLLKSKHDFALLYVGKRQPDPVPAALAAQVAELTAAGKLLEAERADFGVLFRQVHHAPRTTHHAPRATHTGTAADEAAAGRRSARCRWGCRPSTPTRWAAAWQRWGHWDARTRCR